MTKRLRYGPNIIQLLLNKLTFTFFFKEQDCFLFLPVGVYLLKATRLAANFEKNFSKTYRLIVFQFDIRLFFFVFFVFLFSFFFAFFSF